jgi:hypothetical protein
MSRFASAVIAGALVACGSTPAATSAPASATAAATAVATSGATTAPATGTSAARAPFLTYAFTNVRDGSKFTLSDFAGKSVLVIGMAVW